MATKKCENCDAEIGDSEKECPKCGINFDDLEDAISSLTVAQTVAEKRKKAAAEKCNCTPVEGVHGKGCPQFKAPDAPPQKRSRFRALGSALRRRK